MLRRASLELALFAFSCSLLVLAPAALTAQEGAAAPAAPATVQGVPRKDAGWVKRHESMNAKAKTGDIELLFIGDSITQGWEGAGKDVWAKVYAPRKALNLGIGGDRTQHVLWRLDNGNIEGLSPKAAVIMIGTNNSKDDSAEDIAAGITAIVEKLRAKLPNTKILLLGVFPRGEKPNMQREKLAKTSAIVAKLDDGAHVFYLDIGPKFLGENETLAKDVMPDFLHLSPKGYQIWADAIEPKLSEILK